MNSDHDKIQVDQSPAPPVADNTTGDTTPLPSTCGRSLRWRFMGIAAIAGIGSTICGSLIMVTALNAYFGGDFSASDFVTLWLIYIIYTGAAVMPIAIFIAFPLMLLLHNQPGWVWIICSTALGTILSAVALQIVSHIIMWQVLLLLIPYAIIFGILAALFRQRFKTLPKKRANEPVEQSS